MSDDTGNWFDPPEPAADPWATPPPAATQPEGMFGGGIMGAFGMESTPTYEPAERHQAVVAQQHDMEVQGADHDALAAERRIADIDDQAQVEHPEADARISQLEASEQAHAARVVGDGQLVDRYDHAHPGVHQAAVLADELAVPQIVQAGEQAVHALENVADAFLPEPQPEGQ